MPLRNVPRTREKNKIRVENSRFLFKFSIRLSVNAYVYNLEQKYTNVKKQKIRNIAVDNTATNN